MGDKEKLLADITEILITNKIVPPKELVLDLAIYVLKCQKTAIGYFAPSTTTGVSNE